MNYKVIWVLLVLLVKGFCSLKILAVFPHEGKSHLWVFIPIIRQLSARGHDLTVIAHHTMGVTSKNYHEIIVKGEFEGILDYSLGMFDLPGLALSSGSAFVLTSKGIEGCHSMFTNPEVQQLFASDQKFDLILAEMFNSECWLSFVDKFGAPFIGLSSTTMMPWHSGRFGQPDNPAYIPNNHLYSIIL